MELNSLLQYGTLLTFVVAICSLAFAVRSHRRQTNAAIYLDLSQRLQHLYRSVPLELRATRLAGQIPETQDATYMTLLLDFLYLMNSAYTLYEAGLLSGRLWEAIQADMERGLQLPQFRAHWPRLKEEFVCHPGFVQFVDKTQNVPALA